MLLSFAQKLASSPYKATKPRLAVLEFLQKTRKPKTVKEIYSGMASERVDLVSIYRTVELFKQLGIVFSENILGATAYYISTKEHHHITCRKCKKTECVPCSVEIPATKNFTLLKHKLTITGLCKRCAH